MKIHRPTPVNYGAALQAAAKALAGLAVVLCGHTTLAAVAPTWTQHTENSDQRPDRTLTLPTISKSAPAAGRRVAATSSEYAGTNVHHMLYLPADWDSRWKETKRNWPVIVEYTGNYFPASGSTGQVEDAALGYGISGGQFIWVTLPFVSADLKTNVRTWWGDVEATVAYAKANVPRVCSEYGGDSQAVFLCGFSRGAIATNLIGLHDDEIAKLWCGLITHDHYDGQREWKGTSWGTPLNTYRQNAALRLRRINGRPVLICQNGGTDAIKDYLRPAVPLKQFTFVDVNVRKTLGPLPNAMAIHPHTDRWLLKDSPERRRVWDWVSDVLRQQTK